MTTQQWIDQAKRHKDKLLELIRNYHPSSHAVYSRRQKMAITAPNAESACRAVREKIRQDEPNDPAERFEIALTSGDIGEMMNVLNGAWFGVPESTDCWGIDGFNEAVDLLQDPPDEEEAVA